MNLYCKLSKPKRIRYRNPLTDRIEYDKTYILKPDEPIQVPDHIAKQFLKTDPHVVSTKPFASPDSKDEDLNEKVTKDYVPVLNELLKKDLSKLKSDDIIEYGKKLDIKIPHNAKLTLKLAMLEKRIDSLMEKKEND